MQTIKMVVCVDAVGTYAIGMDEESAIENYGDTVDAVDALSTSSGFRIFNITLTVPVPEPVEIIGVVQIDEGPVTVGVKSANT